MTITLLLYRTENPENLGSIARAAANFGFADIILIEPQCGITERTRNFAKHAQQTLDRMRIANAGVLREFDILIATHGRIGKAYNLVRAPITPRQLAGRLEELDKRAKIGILFGPESEGLSRGMLASADIVLAIPTSPEYPSMNLAQSVTVVLYELSMISGQDNIASPYSPMSRQEHDALFRRIDETLAMLPFTTEPQRKTQRLLWQRIVGKSLLTKRECFALIGFLKSIQRHREMPGRRKKG